LTHITKPSANVPSSFIEAAIARGQGRSLSGASLESLSLEVIMPGGVAVIVDVVTDSRLRSLHEINAVVRKHNGKTGASTKFFFTHLRKMVFAAPSDADPVPPPPSDDDLMNFVLLHDAVDFDRVPEEGPDGASEAVVVYTSYEPGKSDVARAFHEGFGFPQRSEDLVWKPKQEMQVALGSSAHAQDLADLLAALQDFSEVSATYINAAQGSVPDGDWERVQQNLIAP
jgi:transcriptional/translational regulatory protein YebC/TACO1